MVPWLAEVSWIKIIDFTYICGYVCVHMNDGSWVWVLAFIKSALCFFLRFWRQRVALMKESSQVFPLNLNCGSAAGFMTTSEKSFLGSRRNDFLAVKEMNWMPDNWSGWFNSSYLYFSNGSKNSFIAGPKI